MHKTSMLIPYEQSLIHTFHKNGNLIPEQNFGEQNHLPTTAFTTWPAHTTPDLATLEPYVTTYAQPINT